MAATRVQAAPYTHNFAAAISVSFSTLPAVGNAIIVEIASQIAGAYAAGQVTDNQTGNTYSLAVGSAGTGGAEDSRVAIFYCASITAPSGTFTVTFTPSSGAAYTSMIAVEWSGLAASPVDATNSATGAATTAPAISTGALAQANEVIVAVIATTFGGTPGTATKDAAFTEDYAELDGSNWGIGEGSYQIVSSTASVTSTWTTDNVTYAAAIASFMVAGAAAPIPDYLRAGANRRYLLSTRW